MPFMVRQDCRCCQEYFRRVNIIINECGQYGMESVEIFEAIIKEKLDNNHCEDCWNK